MPWDHCNGLAAWGDRKVRMRLIGVLREKLHSYTAVVYTSVQEHPRLELQEESLNG